MRARPFNHAGPGQRPIFAISSLARQAAAGLDAGDDPVRVVTGNPDTRRDFTDVRDVVRAYRLLAARGEPGVFNVCSGVVALGARARSPRSASVTGVEVDHEVDPARVRAHEVHGPPRLGGAAARRRPAGSRRSRCARTLARRAVAGSSLALRRSQRGGELVRYDLRAVDLGAR